MTDQTATKLCFVIGPIGAEGTKERRHSEWVLEEIIRPVMASFPAFDVKRADEDDRPGLIDAQIITDLLDADLVIADLSSYSPNAYYEIGIRHMAQKPIIHMQLAEETIPFDLRLYRAIRFSINTPTEIRKAREALKAHVAATQRDGYQVENPVTKARGAVQLKEHATPPEQVLLDQIADLNRRVARIEQPRPINVRWSQPSQEDDAINGLVIKFKSGVDESEKNSFIEIMSKAAHVTPLDDGRYLATIRPSRRSTFHEIISQYRDILDI